MSVEPYRHAAANTGWSMRRAALRGHCLPPGLPYFPESGVPSFPELATIYAFEPYSQFIAALRLELPTPAQSSQLRCFVDEEGDGHVELAVPDCDWEVRLAERMARVTLAILDQHGEYVGLIAYVDTAQRDWGDA